MAAMKSWASGGFAPKAAAPSGSMRVGQWYHQNAGGDIWFLAKEVLKNGGMKGMSVPMGDQDP